MMLVLATIAALATAATFVQDHILLAVAGKFPSEARGVSSPEELVGKIRYSQAHTVILVLHGGLVSVGSSIETAQAIHPALSDVGYPIYVSWETGPGYTLFPPPSSRTGFRFRADAAPEPADVPHPLGETERRLERNTRAVAKAMWSRMKAFARNSNDPTDPEAAMNRLMLALVPLWKERHLNLVVIAHSAGAIFAGHFLEALDRWNPDGKIDLLFMAPACTVDFVAARKDLFERHVGRFMMLGLDDRLERSDAMLAVPGAPRRLRGWYESSVLYFVSNNLEGRHDTPILGMERFERLATNQSVESPRELTAHEREAYGVVERLLRLDSTAFWSDGKGGPTRATTHIGFWLDPATRSTLHTFVKDAVP